MNVDYILGKIEDWVHDPGSWLNSNAKQEMREMLEEFEQQSRIPPGTHFDMVIKGYTKGDGSPIKVGYVDPMANFKNDLEAAEKASEREHFYIAGTDPYATTPDKIENLTDQLTVFHPMPESDLIDRHTAKGYQPVAVYCSRPSAQESFAKTLQQMAELYPAKQVIKENPISFEILYLRQVAGQFAQEVGQQFVDKLIETIREVEPSCTHENLMTKFAHRIVISEEGKGREKNKQVWLKEDPEKPTNSALNPATLLFEFGNRFDIRPFGNTLTFIYS